MFETDNERITVELKFNLKLTKLAFSYILIKKGIYKYIYGKKLLAHFLLHQPDVLNSSTSESRNGKILKVFVTRESTGKPIRRFVWIFDSIPWQINSRIELAIVRTSAHRRVSLALRVVHIVRGQITWNGVLLMAVLVLLENQRGTRRGALAAIERTREREARERREDARTSARAQSWNKEDRSYVIWDERRESEQRDRGQRASLRSIREAGQGQKMRERRGDGEEPVMLTEFRASVSPRPRFCHATTVKQPTGTPARFIDMQGKFSPTKQCTK